MAAVSVLRRANRYGELLMLRLQMRLDPEMRPPSYVLCSEGSVVASCKLSRSEGFLF